MKNSPQTNAIVFPFDLFGGAGTSAGADLLGDALEEILEDNKLETRKIRGDAYKGKIHIDRVEFTTAQEMAEWKLIGRKKLNDALFAGHRTIWLGGNHLSTLPIFEELAVSQRTERTLVMQFDAHLDVYQLHDVSELPANGNFLLHAEDTLPDVVSLGHRDLFLPAREIRNTFVEAFSAEDLVADPARVLTALRKRCEKAHRIWVDIDVDVFDPAHCPAVQIPMPFGPEPLLILSLLAEIWATQKVIGLSISEFDPGRDTNDRSLNLLGWLLEWVLLKWYE